MKYTQNLKEFDNEHDALEYTKGVAGLALDDLNDTNYRLAAFKLLHILNEITIKN